MSITTTNYNAWKQREKNKISTPEYKLKICNKHKTSYSNKENKIQDVMSSVQQIKIKWKTKTINDITQAADYDTAVQQTVKTALYEHHSQIIFVVLFNFTYLCLNTMTDD